ncbi:DedA protein [hydrothermal vent metagenome]|uniref:DedA protein n=1 Tax=hydrothermal vent metagenome TaxID=652676 RepID=A0A3B0XB55_9ZZZZ
MIEQLPDFILSSLEHFHLFAYWLAFIAAFLETALLVGLLIPGSTLLLLLGAYSASGQLEVGILKWFAVAGAILGDNLNYFLGRRYGQRWTEHGLWFLQPEHFTTAGQFFDQHGARSVFLGRFVPSLKEVVPFIAGTLGMHRPVFFSGMCWEPRAGNSCGSAAVICLRNH